MKKMNLNQKFLILILFSFLSISPLAHSQKVYEEVQTAQDNSGDLYSARQNAITRASAKARPAIVGINVTAIEQVISRNPYSMDPFWGAFFGDMFNQRTFQKVHSIGSGFLISSDGYIITNHHVAGNAKEIVVTLTNGEKYNAKIIGADMTSDVALLKIDAKNLPYLKLSNSDDLIIGEWVIAMGNPFGLFDINSKPTVTVGVVSNLDVNMINEDSPQNRVYKGMIQTDAAISSGNSGGPLLNANGDVIGMNTMIFSTSQSNQGSGSIGIGFAIPINRIKSIIDLLKTGKQIDRYTYLGMDIDEINPSISKNYGLEKQEGVYITRIFRNSPVEKAGLELQDIVLSINGMKIFRLEDFYISIFDGKVGDKLTFEVLRQGKIIKKDVILESSRR